MSRPEYPNPYCILPASCIRRIRENQEYYDKNPERAEREQREAKQRQADELRQEQEDYERRLETEAK